MRARKHILVAVYVAVLAAPVAAKLADAPEHALEGAFAPAPAPAPTFEGITSERYQHGTTAWFESWMGLRSWASWIDNTALYHLFGETKWGSHVSIGSGRTLFERDDINYFNRGREDMPAPASVVSFADAILTLQRRLQREGRALVPIFLPSKTTFYRDKVTPELTRDLGEPRPGDVHVYAAMKTALAQRGVRFVDGIELLRDAEHPREVLWGRDARHFSPVAGCLAMDAILGVYADLTERSRVAYPCQPARVRVDRTHSDLDLFRLLNAWSAGRDHHAWVVDRVVPPKPAHAPDALWISTSFGWLLEIDAVQSNLFGEIHLAYYNASLFQDGVQGSTPIEPHTPAWRDVFLTRDLYVLELHESYLVPGTFFGEDAVRAILRDLGP